MKHTKFWSCLIAFVLLVSCVVGIFVVGADAESTTVYYTLGEVEKEGSEHFNTFAEALSALQAKNKEWGANESVEIQFKGDIRGGNQNGILFGLTTVWRADGTKLPITFRGVDSVTERDAYIYLDADGGWHACANDYTFINLTLPVGDQLTEFYAGSGNVRFEDVHFKQQNITIPTSAEQKIEYRLMKAVAETIAERNQADLLPAGDAWMDLIENNPDIGNKLSQSLKNNRPEGDYKHDGDLGGGMYVNACVWYEVLTKRSCVGHTWRPDTSKVGYALDDALITVLQNAAHKAVVGVYGEDYYDSTYNPDLNGDNKLYVLNIGSSNGYYYVDELCQMLTADGYEAYVCTAYHSGVPIAEQWTWAAGTAKGDYQFRTYKGDSVTANVINKPDADTVGFAYFETLHPWDSITFYQTAGPFDDYGLTEAKYNTAYTKILATCAKADNLYAYMRQTNPDARYTWYQVCPNPVGYPGVSTSLVANSGRFYADTCTQEVFAGWPELKEGEKVQTSITFGPGTKYSGDKVKHYIAAVGYMQDYTGDPLTDETAAEVKYMEAAESYGEIPDIRPVDLEASIVIDGGTVYRLSVHKGYAPTDGKILMNSGSVYAIDGDNNTSDVTESFYGDTEIKVMGGTVTGSVYGTYAANLEGDLIMEIGGDAIVKSCVRGTFNPGVVNGDIRITVSGNAQIKGSLISGTVRHAFYGGGNATGEIVNTVSGGTLTGMYFGIRYGGEGKTIVNNITGGTIDGQFYGGHFLSTKIGQIINNFSGGTITGGQTVTDKDGNSYAPAIYAGSYNTNSSAAVTGLPVVIEGKTVTASIVNNISGTTFGTAVTGEDGTVTRSGDFIGSSVAGTVNDIYNIITGGTFNNRFYGSINGKTVGNVVTKVSGDPVFNYAFYGMGKDANNAGSEGKTVTVEVNGGTFNSTFYPSGANLLERVSHITVNDGLFKATAYTGGYTGTAKEINCTVTGGTFETYFYGGMYNDATTINPKQINLTIEGGTFKGAFFGGSRGVRSGNIHVIVRGNPEFKKNFASGGWNKLAGKLTAADTVTGNVKTELYGGTFTNIYCGTSDGTIGNIENIVDGATITGDYHGAYGGNSGTVSNTIKSGTFTGTVYLGPWGSSAFCGDITNNVSGGNFSKTVYFGGKTSTTTTGDIFNTVSGGTFSVAAYLGSANGTVGNITNTISAGTFKQKVYMGSAAGTEKAVSNTISGGSFSTQYNSSDDTKKTYCFYGAGVGSSTSVENTITGGTFYGNTFLGGGGNVSGNIVNVIGNDKGGPNFTTKGIALYCGNSKSGGTVGDINNTFHNGSFKSVYCGNAYSGSDTGSITNVFNGGTYVNSVTPCGYSTTNGKVLTTVNGGDYQEYFLSGGRGTINLPEGSEDYYCVETVVNGGTFKGVWGGGEGTATNRVGNTKLTVYGGTFNEYKATDSARLNALCAGGRGMQQTGNADVFIYGGTFNSEVVAGAYPNSSADNYAKPSTGKATITIYGGTFEKPLLANSKWSTYSEGGTIILNPTESDIIINSTMGMREGYEGIQNYEIVGGDHQIILGADAKIEATSVSGDVKLGQASAWKKQIYVTLPEGNTAKVTVTGTHCFDKKGDSVVAVKGGVQLFGATMILTDRVAIRALFDKTSVEAIDNFTFSFTMPGETEPLASGTKADLIPYGEDYYCIVLAKIGANDFEELVTFAGNEMVWDNEFSIKGLAIIAETAWADNDEGVALAKAMQNFATIVANPGAELPHTLAPDLSKLNGFKASGTKGTSTVFAATGKGLVMGNAVGIRIYGTSDGEVSANTITVKVNNQDVTGKVVFGGADGNYTIDLYVNAKNMSSALKIEILDKAGNACLTLTDRVDAIAASYPETHEKYDVVQQLLVYIQAAVEYAAKAQA